MAVDEEIASTYKRNLAVFEKAKDRFKGLLEEVLRTTGDRTLVRATLLPLRIKTLGSLARKASANGWRPDDALSRCPDLIGARIVCNNTADVYRIVELVKEKTGIGDPPPTVQDYLVTPKLSGYRAVHMNLRVDGGEPLRPEYMGAELQVRTLLQDAWSHLSHDDVYKEGDALPSDLKGRMTDLATVLRAADEVAQRVRDRIGQERPAPGVSPDRGEVSRNALAYLFGQVFGRYASEYILERAYQLAERRGLDGLQEVADAMADPDLRQGLEDAYRKITGWRPDPEDVFLAVVSGGGRSETLAKRWIQREARKSWEEIEAIAAHEEGTALPDSIEEFLEAIRSGDLDLMAIGYAFGVIGECGICGAAILRADALEEAVCGHYGVDSLDGEVETEAWNSGTEVGSFDYDGLCAYHGNLLSKDD